MNRKGKEDPMSNATKLVAWILHRFPYPEQPISHLKLQKLAFYAFGAALAFERERPLGDVAFEAWPHGPVNPEIYHQLKGLGSSPIPREALGVPSVYDGPTERVLDDALAVYGKLDAWSLRQQSHLEAPWALRATAYDRTIDVKELREHFFSKLTKKPFRLPEYIGNFGSFALDGIPIPEFPSFREAAAFLRGTSAASRL
jgi:uncharacterized phage-associated protein